MGDRQRLLNLEDVRGVLGDMFEEITVSGYEWLDVRDQFGTLPGVLSGGAAQALNWSGRCCPCFGPSVT